MNSSNRVLHGIALLIAAVACFALLDTATKFVSVGVPLLMTVWCRYMFQAAITGVVLLPRRGRSLLYTRRPWMHLLRGLLLLLCSVFAFMSLKVMPVGEFTAIVMLTPLLITLIAATSLGEHISLARWLCTLGGFAGALVVIRPGADMFDWSMLLPLGLVATNTGFQVVTSRLARTDDPGTMHFYTGCVGAVATSLALPFAWQALESPALWMGLVLLGVASTVGHFLLILAYMRAPVAVLTPYLYAQIGFATLAGWLVFSHVPDRWAVAGIAAIAVCGALGTWLNGRDSRRPALLATGQRAC
ncbi:DMT family transporter [Azohydromonas caseinilytica]|uniref:DMT family transporter n=1 Tax=Azohydromonas caseinilytica TaxID=2728836 RepID=UPI00197C6E66|nr:DMT family transporter [Azohydromonas caseinilytica]